MPVYLSGCINCKPMLLLMGKLDERATLLTHLNAKLQENVHSSCEKGYVIITRWQLGTTTRKITLDSNPRSNHFY